MKGDDGFCFENTFVAMQTGTTWKRPQEPAEPFHRTRLLENLDRRHHRLEDDRQEGHTVSRQNSSPSPLILALAYLAYFFFIFTLIFIGSCQKIEINLGGTQRNVLFFSSRESKNLLIRHRP